MSCRMLSHELTAPAAPERRCAPLPSLRFLLPSAITIALTKTNECQLMAPGWEEFCLDPKFVSPAQTRAGFVLSSERERMERPNHLADWTTQSNSSKLTGIVIVVGIHVAGDRRPCRRAGVRPDHEADAGNQGLGRRREGAAQGAAAAAAGSGEAAAAGRHRSGIQRRSTEAPPPVTTVAKPPPPPPAAAPPAAPTDRSKPITRTHTLPPYPPISQRLGEQGTTADGGRTSPTEGNVTDVQGHQILQFGASRHAACDYVQSALAMAAADPARASRSPSRPDVSVVWDLKDAQ